MLMRYSLLLGLTLLSLWACKRTASTTTATPLTTNVDPNPAAPGFNAAGSDARAVALADSVMLAMGGRPAWDKTRYLHWNFFGRRKLLWDKWTGDVRIDFVDSGNTYLVNVNSGKGKIRRDGQEVTHPDSLSKYLGQAKSIWINDSYWLVMPYKLKDSGVTLRYLGEENTTDGRPAHKLQLTFEAVGDTPRNKYHVYVDRENHLVTQWSYFADAADAEPRFTNGWTDYQRHGDILLSGARGQRGITEIAVYEEVPAAAFSSFEDWK